MSKVCKFPTRAQAKAVMDTLDHTARDLHLSKVDESEGGGWVIVRRDWSLSGVELYWHDDGWGGWNEY